MASYHTRIGPWPIKRSQSVPDASEPLLAPRDDRLTMAELLAKDEGRRGLEEYSRLLKETDKPRMEKRHKEKPRFKATDWFQDIRYQKSVDLEKNISAKETCKKKKKSSSNNEAAALKATLLVGLLTLAIIPLQITEFFRDVEALQLTLPENAPSTVLLYSLICLFAIMIGMVVSVAWFSIKMGSGQELAATASKRDLLANGLILGTILSVWWICLVLPPIAHQEAKSNV